jgi:hypothetical protein
MCEIPTHEIRIQKIFCDDFITMDHFQHDLY